MANKVNWFEGAGIPFSAFDDVGRENAYPLVRVQAKNGNTTLATVDTVLPISGEASCTNCHADPSRRAEQPLERSRPTALRNAGLPVATSLDDPDANMPSRVSVEYAADINILRLHDLKHGARYVSTACDTCRREKLPQHGGRSLHHQQCQPERDGQLPDQQGAGAEPAGGVPGLSLHAGAGPGAGRAGGRSRRARSPTGVTRWRIRATRG